MTCAKDGDRNEFKLGNTGGVNDIYSDIHTVRFYTTRYLWLSSSNMYTRGNVAEAQLFENLTLLFDNAFQRTS